MIVNLSTIELSFFPASFSNSQIAGVIGETSCDYRESLAAVPDEFLSVFTTWPTVAAPELHEFILGHCTKIGNVRHVLYYDLNESIYVLLRMNITSKEELADFVIDFLNGLIETDKKALSQLIETRVPCSENLVCHKTVQVSLSDSVPSVGFLGILNGMVGTIEGDHPKRGWGLISAEFGDDGELQRFLRTV